MLLAMIFCVQRKEEEVSFFDNQHQSPSSSVSSLIEKFGLGVWRAIVSGHVTAKGL